jgi:hypothetical protein
MKLFKLHIPDKRLIQGMHTYILQQIVKDKNLDTASNKRKISST